MIVGVDVGGTTTAGVALDADGNQLARARKVTVPGTEAVVGAIQAVVAELAASVPEHRAEIESIGVGIPGRVDAGHVTHAVNIDVVDLDLAGVLEERLGAPVTVENDVKAAALGAAREIGAEGSLAYLNLGTGVAAGIVVDGQIWNGASGAAGEIGHLSIRPDGRECPCGQRGCIETLAGGGSIAARWGRAESFPVRAMFDAADAGDPEALAIRDDLALGVSSAVRALALTVDVDSVVFGGGISALGERLLGLVQDRLRSEASRSRFLASLNLDSRISIVPHQASVAALGAALVGLQKEKVYG